MIIIFIAYTMSLITSPSSLLLFYFLILIFQPCTFFKVRLVNRPQLHWLKKNPPGNILSMVNNETPNGQLNPIVGIQFIDYYISNRILSCFLGKAIIRQFIKAKICEFWFNSLSRTQPVDCSWICLRFIPDFTGWPFSTTNFSDWLSVYLNRRPIRAWIRRYTIDFDYLLWS